MLQTLKLNNQKSSFYEENSLVGLIPATLYNWKQEASQKYFESFFTCVKAEVNKILVKNCPKFLNLHIRENMQ